MSNEIEDLRDDIRELEGEREDLLNEIGSLEDDVAMWERRAYKAEGALRTALVIMRSLEPTVPDQLLRFDIRISIAEIEEVVK